MRRQFTLSFLGLFMALGSSSLLHAQQIQPASYEDLVSRLQAVESELSAQRTAATQPDFGPGTNQFSNGNSGGVRGGLFVSYENVWIKPFFSHNEAYQVFDAIPGIPESSQIVEFDWSFKSTPRIELGYIVPGSGIGWRARYWQFSGGVSSQASDPNPAIGRIEVGLHDDPDIEVSTLNDEFVRAMQSLKLEVVDLEVMSRRESANSEFTASGGLRYVRMDQGYVANFTNANTGIINNIVTSRHFFEGIGPTLALEGVRRMGTSSWSVFGKTRGSLLLGDSGLEQASIDPQTVAAPVRDYVTASNSLDLQFIGELQAGIQYERRLCNGAVFFGRLGGEVQFWPSGGSAAFQNGEDSDGQGQDPRDADMGFFGLSAALGTKW